MDKHIKEEKTIYVLDDIKSDKYYIAGRILEKIYAVSVEKHNKYELLDVSLNRAIKKVNNSLRGIGKDLYKVKKLTIN